MQRHVEFRAPEVEAAEIAISADVDGRTFPPDVPAHAPAEVHMDGPDLLDVVGCYERMHDRHARLGADQADRHLAVLAGGPLGRAGKGPQAGVEDEDNGMPSS